MTALTADTAAHSFRRIVVRVVGMIAALGIATGCMSDDQGRPSNQATGTFMGAALGGVVC